MVLIWLKRGAHRLDVEQKRGPSIFFFGPFFFFFCGLSVVGTESWARNGSKSHTHAGRPPTSCSIDRTPSAPYPWVAHFATCLRRWSVSFFSYFHRTHDVLFSIEYWSVKPWTGSRLDIEFQRNSSKSTGWQPSCDQCWPLSSLIIRAGRASLIFFWAAFYLRWLHCVQFDIYLHLLLDGIIDALDDGRDWSAPRLFWAIPFVMDQESFPCIETGRPIHFYKYILGIECQHKKKILVLEMNFKKISLVLQ